jgi:hypothetical protein
MLEPKEFRLQICCGPEQRAVEELAPNGVHGEFLNTTGIKHL